MVEPLTGNGDSSFISLKAYDGWFACRGHGFKLCFVPRVSYHPSSVNLRRAYTLKLR